MTALGISIRDPELLLVDLFETTGSHEDLWGSRFNETPFYLCNSGGAQLKEVGAYPRDAIFELVLIKNVY